MFNTTRLSGSRVLVTGDADQKCVLSSVGYDQLLLDQAHESIEKVFEDEVNDFFAPLIEAQEAAEAAHEAAHKKYDDGLVVVIEEAVESVEGRPAKDFHMDHDTAVLFYIENDQTRLIWVGNDQIEILAVEI